MVIGSLPNVDGNIPLVLQPTLYVRQCKMYGCEVIWSKVAFLQGVRGPTVSLTRTSGGVSVADFLLSESSLGTSVVYTQWTSGSYTHQTSGGDASDSTCTTPLAREWVHGVATVGLDLWLEGSGWLLGEPIYTP